MHSPAAEGIDGRSTFVSRRRLFRLAGIAGAAATVAACSNRNVAEGVTDSTPPPNPRPVLSAGPPQPVATSTPVSSETSAAMLCRDSWGARPARSGGIPHTLSWMTVHHTGVVLRDNRNAPARLREHQRYHQDENGWIDIAYHVGVDRDGNIFELRAPELAGDTATNYDPAGHFLVVCEGDFDQEAVTEAQLHGAALTFAWAAQTFGIATDMLAGHRDVSADTACPGANLYAHVSSGDLKRRVDQLLATGPVDLQRVCGPDAASIVARIESSS